MRFQPARLPGHDSKAWINRFIHISQAPHFNFPAYTKFCRMAPYAAHDPEVMHVGTHA